MSQPEKIEVVDTSESDDSLETYRREAQARWRLFMSGAIADRSEMIAVFATLPDEAFSFVAFQLWQTAQTNGGFQAEGRKALDAFSAACKRWIDQKQSQVKE